MDNEPTSKSNKGDSGNTNNPAAPNLIKDQGGSVTKTQDSNNTHKGTSINPAKDAPNKFQVAQLIATISVDVLVLVVIAIQAGIYYSQLQEMRGSNRATMKAAKAAEDSVVLSRENAHIDLRAWVSTKSGGSSVIQVGKKVSSSWQINNAGKTFARNVRSVQFLEAISDPYVPDFRKADDLITHQDMGIGVSHLSPSDYSHIIVTSNEVLTDEVFNKIKSGDIRVFVYGKITYMDIFDCQHWTTYCYRLQPDDFSFAVWTTHNDFDHNK